MPKDNRYFTVVLDLQDDGAYTVTCPALPGCISEGDNLAGALRNIEEAIQLVLEAVEDQDGDERGRQSPSLTFPLQETPELIAEEVKNILADRVEDGLSYEGVSTARVEIPVRLQV